MFHRLRPATPPATSAPRSQNALSPPHRFRAPCWERRCFIGSGLPPRPTHHHHSPHATPHHTSPKGAADSAQGQPSLSEATLGFRPTRQEANPRPRRTPRPPAASSIRSAARAPTSHFPAPSPQSPARRGPHSPSAAPRLTHHPAHPPAPSQPRRIKKIPTISTPISIHHPTNPTL